MPQFDITILTDQRYLAPSPGVPYIENIFLEAQILTEALEQCGFNVTRTNWDDPDFNWTATRFAIFRTTWDYFDRFPEFSKWLDATEQLTKFINPVQLLRWNMDKHYLIELQEKGIPIPTTEFIKPGETRSLPEIMESLGWDEFVLKPAVSGAGRHTYRIKAGEGAQHEAVFKELIAKESMLLQAFMHNVPTKGEVAFMVIGGKFTHAVLKRAKKGDFRVQDDFGGTLHEYHPSAQEIAFAQEAVKACPSLPYYARVDVIWDNDDQLCISELEMIEPELWFRRCPEAAMELAKVLKQDLLE